METEWISVKDRLPEDHTRCLVFESRNREGYQIEIQYYFRMFPNGVTHWMPLPSPPNSQ